MQGVAPMIEPERLNALRSSGVQINSFRFPIKVRVYASGYIVNREDANFVDTEEFARDDIMKLSKGAATRQLGRTRLEVALTLGQNLTRKPILVRMPFAARQLG